MLILGVSCYNHDSAAAIIEDGLVVAAAAEEHFTRVKHDSRFPFQAISYCLSVAGVRSNALDYVAFYERPGARVGRILDHFMANGDKWEAGMYGAAARGIVRSLSVRRKLASRLGVSPDRVVFVDHHTSHAASAFLCSPFQEAAILTVDGVGESVTATIAYGSRGSGSGHETEKTLPKISGLWTQRFPHSLGLLYSTFTSYLGCEVNEGEYKVMGMAAYGEPTWTEEIKRLIHVDPTGDFELDLSYFGFLRSSRMYNDKFVQVFGSPRNPGEPFLADITRARMVVPSDNSSKNRADLLASDGSRRFSNIAASLQHVTEEVLIKLAFFAHRLCQTSSLCAAGGVMLNSVANGRILREGPFAEVFVQPAAGDAGGALGAALYVANCEVGGVRPFYMDHAFWGPYCTDASGVAERRQISDEIVAKQVTRDLVSGRVIGLIQGRAEWGPRALGNRSILADPRSAAMRSLVNLRVKDRELFRPLAPAVLSDDLDFLFEQPEGLRKSDLGKFMLATWPVTPDAADALPAVVHVDRTARPQVVDRATNPLLFYILKSFAEVTGQGVVLNTSLNIRNEPIVRSSRDGFRMLQEGRLDVLYLNGVRFAASGIR